MINKKKNNYLFSDIYFNSKSNDIKDYATYLNTCSIDTVMHILEDYMEDTLVNLLGFNNINDIINYKMISDLNYHLSYFIIGKKKLTEILSLLEELNDYLKFIDINKYTFKNIKNIEINNIYANYLGFTNINEFLKQVINIITNHPLKELDLENIINLNIPNPTDYDMNIYYYDEINSMKVIGDTENFNNVKKGHDKIGVSVDAQKWINNFISKTINQKKEDKVISKQEEDKQKIANSSSEVEQIKNSLKNLRDVIYKSLSNEDKYTSLKEINDLENSFIVKTVTGKDLKKAPNYSSYENIINILIKNKNNLNNKNVLDLDDAINKLDTRKKKEKPTQVNNKFMIGSKIIYNDDLILTYLSPTTKEIYSILENDGIIIGFVPVIERNGYLEKFDLCKNKKDIEEFLNKYLDIKEKIRWRCALNTNPSDYDDILTLVNNNENIDSNYITCYIDYDMKNNKQGVSL